MVVDAPSVTSSSSPDSPDAAFLALLPRLEHLARRRFRHIDCPSTREDRVAESVALAWKWHLSLAKRGRDIQEFPLVFIWLVLKAVGCNRQICAQAKAKDVMSLAAQRKYQFRVVSLSSSQRSAKRRVSKRHGVALDNAVEDRLADDTHSPIPDQAAFRIDWPAFCESLPERDRRMIEFLALDHSGRETSAKFGVSAARVTQLRQQWRRQWLGRHGQEAVGDSQVHQS